jgi:hypothetical protein
LGKDLSKQKLELIFWKMEASKKTKVLKNVVDKKPRKNSTGVISVWTGLEREKTEPNQTEKFRFGSKTKKKSVWLFILVQNRTGPKMLSPILDLAPFL